MRRYVLPAGMVRVADVERLLSPSVLRPLLELEDGDDGIQLGIDEEATLARALGERVARLARLLQEAPGNGG